MTRWQPMSVGRGRVQAGVPLQPRDSGFTRAGGLLFRGVVVTTYELDNPDHPQGTSANGVDPVAIYCDVLLYTSMQNQRFQFLKSVLVSQEVGGMHRGRVWKPRAARLDITKNPIDLDRATNPANLDGDHVLVGFMDDNLNQPVILRGIPHPSADEGNDEKPPGSRLRLKVADGDPDFQKHHGAFYGVSDDGDFTVDTTLAYPGGGLNPDGTEPLPPADGTAGNYQVRLPEAAKLTIEINGQPSMELDLSGPDAKLTLGDGLQSAVIAEALQAFWDSVVKPVFDLHLHPTGVGPSGPPAPLLPVYPVASISTKVKIPDG